MDLCFKGVDHTSLKLPYNWKIRVLFKPQSHLNKSLFTTGYKIYFFFYHVLSVFFGKFATFFVFFARIAFVR